MVAAFNSSNVATLGTVDAGNSAAMNVLETALYAAEATWMATVQPAVEVFQATNNTAWSGYVVTEATSWNQYQLSMIGITVQQQLNYDAAWATYQTNMTTAATAFSARESTAWDAYQQTLVAGETSGARLAAVPAELAPAPRLLPTPIAPAPRLAPVQGRLPPIDWSNGKPVEKNVTLFAGGPACTSYEIEIGKNKFGEPIKIRYWQVNGPHAVDSLAEKAVVAVALLVWYVPQAES